MIKRTLAFPIVFFRNSSSFFKYVSDEEFYIEERIATDGCVLININIRVHRGLLQFDAKLRPYTKVMILDDEQENHFHNSSYLNKPISRSSSVCLLPTMKNLNVFNVSATPRDAFERSMAKTIFIYVMNNNIEHTFICCHNFI